MSMKNVLLIFVVLLFAGCQSNSDINLSGDSDLISSNQKKALEEFIVSENEMIFDGETFTLPENDVFKFSEYSDSVSFGPKSIVPELPTNYDDVFMDVFLMTKASSNRKAEDVIRSLEKDDNNFNINHYTNDLEVVSWDEGGMCSYSYFEIIGEIENILISGHDCSENDMHAYIEEFLGVSR